MLVSKKCLLGLMRSCVAGFFRRRYNTLSTLKTYRFLYVLLGLYTLLICGPLNGFAQQIKNESRTTLNFNRDWKFKSGDFEGAKEVLFKDGDWQGVGLPHSFSIPYFMSPDFYTGYGWYRKHFSLNSPKNGKLFFLEFEGVFQQAEVYVNGKKVGEHTGGYTGFSIDITSALRQKDNLIAVRVNNIWRPDVAPRAGEHTFSGGIYRDVRMVVTNPIHIDWCGTFITTPKVSNKQASLNVQTSIKNQSLQKANVNIRSTVFDPDHHQVLSVDLQKQLNPSDTTNISVLKGHQINNPKLWSPDHPFLYTLVNTIYNDGKKADEEKIQFGIRSIRWTADSGFFLNGRHLYLRGANVHQDHAGWGDAVTNAGFYRDVKMLKDAGFNFIRGSHYPHDPAFAEACDQLGVLFWSENNFWGIGGSDSTPEGYWNSSAYPTHAKDSSGFNKSIKQELREMIRIYRNHPSIIAWSVSNEPFFTAKNTLTPMRELLRSLVATVHADDPTRPAAVGGAQRPLHSTRIDHIGDVAGYNGDGGILPVFHNPGVANVVSEYGSVTADRPGVYDANWGDLASDSNRSDYTWRGGQAIWCAFDHGSIAGEALGKMGIIDYFRIPKRSWYWYRNKYKGIPPPVWPKPGIPAALRIDADKLIAATDGDDDVKLTVTVLDVQGKPISNSPDVKLSIVSGPGEFPTGRAIDFSEKSDIRILDGQAAIEYRSWYAGKSIVRATSPGLKQATIVINFTGNYPYHKGIKQISRPYHRFKNPDLITREQLFGPNNPTFASSSSAGHASGLAADGDEATYWQPDPSDQNPFWMLDTEKSLNITSVNICFESDGEHKFQVQFSSDKKSWTNISDFRLNPLKQKCTKLKFDNVEGRAVRILFDSKTKTGIAEVQVWGKVLDM